MTNQIVFSQSDPGLFISFSKYLQAERLCHISSDLYITEVGIYSSIQILILLKPASWSLRHTFSHRTEVH